MKFFKPGKPDEVMPLWVAMLLNRNRYYSTP